MITYRYGPYGQIMGNKTMKQKNTKATDLIGIKKKGQKTVSDNKSSQTVGIMPKRRKIRSRRNLKIN